MLTLCGRLLVPISLFAYVSLYYFSVRDLPAAARLLPQMLLAVLSVLLVLVAWSELRRWRSEDRRSLSGDARQAVERFRKHHMKTALIVLMSFAWIFFGIGQAGFYESTSVFIAASLLTLGERRLWLVAILAVSSLGLCYALFEIGLNVQLPDGFIVTRS